MSKGWIIYWTIVIGVLVIALASLPLAVLEGVGKIIGALSPLLTVALAIFGLYVWRVQLVAKRRFEVAEEVIFRAQAAVFALSDIRNPAGFGGEGSTRQPEPNEDPNEKKELDRLYAPIERINRHVDDFAALFKAMILADAYLGPDVAEQVKALLVARNKVVMAAKGLAVLRRQANLSDLMLRKMEEWQAMLYETAFDFEEPGHPLNDVLTRDIERAKAEIDKRCRMYLATPRLKDILLLSAPASPTHSTPSS